MKKIPIEFLPGFWVSLPEGIEGEGSGFLLAEHIQCVFPVDVTVPPSENNTHAWSVLPISETEVGRDVYLAAFVRLITESWLESSSVMVIGPDWALYRILERFLVQVAGVEYATGTRIVKSKLGKMV
jgi:hypothetical protein